MAGIVMRYLMAGVFVIGLFLMVWDMGYATAYKNMAGQWYEGPEGYCLAQNHPGACK